MARPARRIAEPDRSAALGLSQVPFDSLPDDARVWCFAAEPEPGPGETALLLDSMKQFIEQWTAHRHDLAAGLIWMHQRFLLVGLDEGHVDSARAQRVTQRAADATGTNDGHFGGGAVRHVR